MIFIDRQPQMPFGAQLINRHRNGHSGWTDSQHGSRHRATISATAIHVGFDERSMDNG
jgi:hypothetical protein